MLDPSLVDSRMIINNYKYFGTIVLFKINHDKCSKSNITAYYQYHFLSSFIEFTTEGNYHWVNKGSNKSISFLDENDLLTAVLPSLLRRAAKLAIAM